MNEKYAAQAQELVHELIIKNYERDDLMKEIAAALAAAAQEGRAQALEQSLAIYEKGFEENWVVQDVIDAIRALKVQP